MCEIEMSTYVNSSFSPQASVSLNVIVLQSFPHTGRLSLPTKAAVSHRSRIVLDTDSVFVSPKVWILNLILKQNGKQTTYWYSFRWEKICFFWWGLFKCIPRSEIYKDLALVR